MPWALRAADRLEEVLDLLFGEGGGRLVEHHDLGLAGERAGDLDDLLLGGVELADEGAHRQANAEIALEQGVRPLLQRAAIDQRTTGAGALVAEEDRLAHREGRHQQAVLVDEADAELGRALRAHRRDGFAVDRDGAFVGHMEAGEDLDEGRLAGTVLADEAVDLAAADLERGTVEGADAPEGLDEARMASAREADLRS